MDLSFQKTSSKMTDADKENIEEYIKIAEKKAYDEGLPVLLDIAGNTGYTLRNSLLIYAQLALVSDLDAFPQKIITDHFPIDIQTWDLKSQKQWKALGRDLEGYPDRFEVCIPIQKYTKDKKAPTEFEIEEVYDVSGTKGKEYLSVGKQHRFNQDPTFACQYLISEIHPSSVSKASDTQKAIDFDVKTRALTFQENIKNEDILPALINAYTVAKGQEQYGKGFEKEVQTLADQAEYVARLQLGLPADKEKIQRFAYLADDWKKGSVGFVHSCGIQSFQRISRAMSPPARTTNMPRQTASKTPAERSVTHGSR